MRGKTIFASLVTLAFMCSFVLVTFASLAIAASDLGLGLGLALGVGITVLWSALMWLISPLIMDAFQRWLYSARPMPIEQLGQMRPAVAHFVGQVCSRHHIKVPRLKFIDDGTPQAYCYGSRANDARLVVTRGLMDTLDDEELKTVYAHELGHIVHRDFIVMTIASTLLNVLWSVYVIAKKIKGRNNSRPGYPIAIMAFVFHWISQYLLLYLSRAREYYADDFAGQETGNPNALSLALVKIANGITQIENTPFQQKLLGGTRALGIADSRSASGMGWAYQAMNQSSAQTPGPAPGLQPAYAGGYAPQYGAPPAPQGYGQPAAQAYGQAYGGQPYGQAPGQPYGQAPGQPYGQAPGQPYGQAPGQPYGQAPGQPYGQAPGQPYGQAPGQPYGPVAAPYAQSVGRAPAVTWQGVRKIEKVMLFDLYNPWAKVCELGSTHPLTGKRIHALGQLAISRGQPPLLTFEQFDASGQALDKGRLYGSFLFEVTIHFLPYIFAVMFVVLSVGCAGLGRYALSALFSGLILFGIGLGMTIKGFYRFPPLGDPAPTTVLDLMSDPYASPLRGRPVLLDGIVTGRASAGNKVGEDFLITDRSAGLMMINYESILGFLGNLWFATRRVGKLMNQQVQVLGWFRRGISQQVDLKSLRSQDGGQVGSWTAFWGKVGGIVVLIVGLFVGIGAYAAASEAHSALSGADTPSATTRGAAAAALPGNSPGKHAAGPEATAAAAAPVVPAATPPTTMAPIAAPKTGAKPAVAKPAAKPGAKPPGSH